MTEYLTPDQAATRHPVFGNADWYREQMRLGKLEGSKIGGRWFTTEAAIEAMAEAASNSTRRRRRRAA